MLPKNYLDKWKVRHQAIGKERRRNMCKVILENAVNFPKAVSYSDIDYAFQKWVEDSLDITYNGKRFPTFRLYSNQRINEYAQTWQHLDEVGNLLMNFKTITRENNPKKGENQGSYYNIPGDRNYPMFMVPTLQENGQEAYDMYSMKQPFSVDMLYTVNIITNNYEVLNMMNELVHDQFKAINAYIAPNGHFMPMVLENISDESEYNIDDRKYYSQNFQIRIKAYIIKESDFTVTNLPSRAVVRTLGDTHKRKVKVQVEEEEMNECSSPTTDSRFKPRSIVLTINFPNCSNHAEFTLDTQLEVEEIKLTNVYDFKLFVNKELQTFEYDTLLYDGDLITVDIERDNLEEESVVIIKGFDNNKPIDTEYNPESSLDDQVEQEDIIYNV